MDFYVIIPARYESRGFSGKVLADIAGKPMLNHVYDKALESGATDIIVATDDERIAEVAQGAGARTHMTSSHHRSSMARIAEVVNIMDFDDDDIIVNVQPDEPLIPPEVIHQVAKDIAGHELIKMCTVCKRIHSQKELFDTNVTKVVLNKRSFAVYFSRAPIPWDREHFAFDTSQTVESSPSDDQHFAHVGVNAFKASLLREYINWLPCDVERLEQIEELRVLWNGGRIHAYITDKTIPPGVDTEQDLQRVRDYLS